MIEAHIVGPRGSLYYSAPTTPYNLENLRTHVRDADAASPRQVRVELTIHGVGRTLAPGVSNLIRDLTAKGIAVRVR